MLRSTRSTRSQLIAAGAALMLAALPAAAQTPTQQPPPPPVAVTDSTVADTAGAVRCTGQLISEVDIRAQRPPFKGYASLWRRMARKMGLHHSTTEPDVIKGFLQLHAGERCAEYRRIESARVLRAQPFLADARVLAIPDSTGGVRIVVVTVDEVPTFISGRTSGLRPQALTIGNSNVRGQGISIGVSGEIGHAYRDGIGLTVTDFALFGRPYAGTVQLERRTIGSLVAGSLARPFYTDLQRTSWHVGISDDRGYRTIVRPAQDGLALGVHQVRWDIGGVNRRRLFGEVGALGAELVGVRDTPANAGVLITDKGMAADTGITLRDRYAPFRVVRPTVLMGMRLVRFVPVRGFTTLTSVEDLMSGIQFGVAAGRSIPAWGASDVGLSGALYAGFATPRSLVAMQMEVEGRRDLEVDEWNGFVTSSRLAWYRKFSPTWTFMLSDEFAGGSKVQLPLQLTLGDNTGGLRGFGSAPLSGDWRNVARIEQRWTRARWIRNADVGFAAFGDGGSLWAGDAPYGRSVGLRTSAGLSVLAAYPSGSKRLLRVDFAVPMSNEGNRRYEIRFTSLNPTRLFWDEPGDVSRARTGPVPSSLFVFPAR